MKKIIFAAFCLLPLLGESQMLEKDNFVVELSLGYPNLKPVFLNSNTFFHSGINLQESDERSFGQFILKGEFMMTDRFGFVASAHYSYFSSHEVANYSTWNSTTQAYETGSYYYDSEIHKMRLTVGFNYHVLRSRHVDSYFGLLAGGKKAWLDFKTDDPAILNEPGDFINPYAMRVHYGLRFFFNHYLAIHTEIGLGGPLVSFGLTCKLK
jgi:hypothetical protein